MAIFLIIALLFLLMPLFMVLLVVFIYRRGERARKSRSADYRHYAQYNRYSFNPRPESWKTTSSYSNGNTFNAITGTLPQSHAQFVHYQQEEIQGQITLERAVLMIDIPDTLSHFIINSKLHNNQEHDSNLDIYDREQKIQLEGDFSRYFDVLKPRGSGSNILILLTPDVMEFLLQNMHQYDIEILGSKLYIYQHKVPPASHLTYLIPIVDQLINMLALARKDARMPNQAISDTENSIPSVVARTAKHLDRRHSLAQSKGSILLIIGFFIFLLALPAAIFFDNVRDIAGVIIAIYIFASSLITIPIYFRRQKRSKKLHETHRERYRR